MTDPRRDLYGELAHRRRALDAEPSSKREVIVVKRDGRWWFREDRSGAQRFGPYSSPEDAAAGARAAGNSVVGMRMFGSDQTTDDQAPTAPTTGPMALSPLTPEQLDEVLRHVAWLTNQYPPGHDDEPEVQPESGGGLVVKGQGWRNKLPAGTNVGLGRAEKSITAAPGNRSELPSHMSNAALTAAAVNPISGDDGRAEHIEALKSRLAYLENRLSSSSGEEKRNIEAQIASLKRQIGSDELAPKTQPPHAPLATDPPVSEPQRRAMFAAAGGHSTLGIPKKVGEHFVGKVD